MEKDLKKYLPNGEFLNVPEKTKKTMSAIKGKNNKTTETRLRMALIRNRISGWLLQNKKLPGKPDFYFTIPKLAIFVDGCFWHGCPRCGHIPKTNTKFWESKITKNVKRDKKNNNELKKLGITLIRFWEHELKDKDLSIIIKKITKILSRKD